MGSAGNHNPPPPQGPGTPHPGQHGPSIPPRSFDAAQVAAFLGFLLDPAVGCVEMRLFGAWRSHKTHFIEPAPRQSLVLSGWYDRIDAAVAEAQGIRNVSVYTTVNPVHPDLLCRARNRLIQARQGNSTNDGNIVCHRWLYIDCDCARTDGISATQEERDAALALRDRILAAYLFLRDSAIWGGSGNGGWILARLADLPNTRETYELLGRVLSGLAEQFGKKGRAGDLAFVDEKTKNASRVMCLPGTLKCKGEDDPRRPWRLVTIEGISGNGNGAGMESLGRPQDWRPAPVDVQGWAGMLPEPTSKPTAVFLAPEAANGWHGPGVAPQQGAPRPGGKPTPPAEGVYDRAWAEYRCRKMIFGPDFGRSIAGMKGHDALFHAAAMIWSDFGLTDEVGFGLFEEWNRTMASPPESEGQVRHKWESVAKTKGSPTLGEYWKARKNDGGRNGEPFEAVGVQGNGDGLDDDNNDGIIVITTRENAVVDQAVEAMGALSEVYQRGNQLVRVLRDVATTKKFLRPPGSPRISLLPKPRLRELMSIAASWKAVTDDGKLKNAHPPSWCIDAMMARGEWVNIRYLEAVIETPVIRHDGTILDRLGWDPETTLLYEPEIVFPAMPTGLPSLDEAKAAKDQLLDVVSEFPWASGAHEAAWLAALLTPLARFAIDGPCPLFLFDANAPGSGKSLLCDLIAIITSGRTMPRTAYPEGDDEMRKRITSIALAGDRLMMLDNIATTFGGSALDGMLTARTWKDRILGKTEMSCELPLFTVWYGTGNNVALRGDALRRVLPSRLEAKEECPEERTEFTHERLVDWVMKERGPLVRACLVILAGYVQAGMPNKLPPLGSFESWSDVVRSAVNWVTGIDPCSTRKELTATDAETNIRTALVEGWHQMDWEGTGKTVTQALQMLRENPNGNATLHSAALEISRTEGLPNSKSLSMRLSRLKGRVINGKCLVGVPYQGTMIWKVKLVSQDQQGGESEGIHSRGTGWSGGTDSPTPREGVVYICPEGDLVGWREETHETNESHETNEESDSTPF
jgi:hypothetical protein